MRRLMFAINLFLTLSILIGGCGPAAQSIPTAPAAPRPSAVVPTSIPASVTPPAAPSSTAPAAAVPTIVSRSPQDSLLHDRRAVFALTFDRKMDAASVADALSLTPTLPLRLSWEDNTLIIVPIAPMDPGGYYQFTLAARASALDGTPMATDYHWSFWLADLISNTSLPTASRTTPVTLGFNYALNPASVGASLTISPAISGALTWADKNMTAIFSPTQPWLNNTTYTLSFGSALQDTQGDALAAPRPFTFTTPSPVIALDPAAGNIIDPAAALHVTFDRPMDHATTEAAFSLTPPVTGTIDWVADTMNFHPTDNSFNENADYLATIGVSARGADGQPILKQPFSWSFHTGRLASQASFGQGANAQVLDASGRRAVQFVLAQIDPSLIGFDLYHLTLAQFLDRYSSGFRGVIGNGRTKIKTVDLPLVTHWHGPAQTTKSQWGETVTETIIPTDVVPGLYLLNLNAGRVDDQLLLIISRQVVMVKRAPGQLVAWVTDMQGQAAVGRPVALYARDGHLITQGQTDREGVFRTPVSLDPQPLIVVAQDGDDYTASGLSNEWLSPSGNWYDWWQPRPAASQFTEYIYTDRPIYRPGQTVYYKAILRQDNDALLTVPPEKLPVTVQLRDARDNVVQTVTLATNQFGSVNGQFQLAEGAMLGDYNVEVTAGGERHRQTFKVQDYAKPDYAVTVTPDASSYAVGDAIRVSLEAHYFYGQPVPQAAIVVKQYQLGTVDCYAATCEDQKFIWYHSDQPEIDAVTDANGRYTFTVTAALGAFGNSPYGSGGLARGTWGIEATVDDGSHQAVSSFTVVNVFSAGQKLSLNMGSYFQSPGQPFQIVETAVDLNDQPLAGRPLLLELRQWDPSTSDYNRVAQSQALGVTDAAGRIATTLTVAQTGYYQVHLSGLDPRGNAVSYNTWLYVFSPDEQWASRYANNDLAIGADRASYAAGDQAQLAITSSFSGAALLTFERGTTRREQLVQLTAPLTRVNVKIQPDDAPNIFVTVNAWKQITTTLTSDAYQSLADRHLRTAQVELRVPVTDNTLTVALTPNKSSYSPREPATFTVRVTNGRGEPVSAEVSLALVDEAIFSLSADRSGSIFDAFYFERGKSVTTFDSMALYRYLYLDGGGRGGGGGGGLVNGTPRSDFPDTAGWVPVLQTDWKGEAVVTLPLPDSLTTWRLTARAVTADTQVGEATTSIVTQKPIVVQPVLPRSLTTGDHVELSAIVHNFSTAAVTLSVALKSDLLRVDQSITQTLRLAPNAQGTVGWTAVAAAAGDAAVTIWADGAAGGDAVRLSLPIHPLAVPDVTTQVGEFSGQFETTITLPSEASDLSTVHIELSPSIAASLLSGLDYLTGFPYGCVEQTMSRALPNAVVGRAFKQLGLTNPTLQADLPPKINASVQRLYGFQHNDGGWGWWFDDDTDAYETAWVVFGLSVTKEAGYEVDPAVVGRGAKWLAGNLGNMDDRTQAFALYSLAIAGQGDLGATQTLAARASQLDTFSQAALALALHRLGAARDSQSLLDLLAQTAVMKDGDVYWPNADVDGHYQQKTMASTTRSTALALDAFVQISPNHPLVSGIVRWLMGQRREQGWGSTNETSFAILALTDHTAALEKSIANTAYTVILNGLTLKSGMLGRGQPAVSMNISAIQLVRGANLLELRQDGGGQLYYVITRRLYLAQSNTPASGTVGVSRAYLAAGTSTVMTQTAAGDLIAVSLTVDLPQDATYVIVEDNLPGGLEALNEGLNNASHDGQAQACGSESDCEQALFHWQELGYNYKEVRGDRVSFFITTLAAGRHTFTYYARVAQRGAFVALPAQVYAMYDARVWGRSSSGQFVAGD